MEHIIEDYGLLVIETLGAGLVLGLTAGFIKLLTEHGGLILNLVF